MGQAFLLLLGGVGPMADVLKTLSDAGHFVTSLPKAKHDRPEWRLAAAMLMQAA